MKSKPGQSLLVDRIGETAMLELLAEESTELTFACLKLARMMRGENPVFGHKAQELIENLHEEIADVYVCYAEMFSACMIDGKMFCENVERKQERIRERFSDHKKKEAE